MKILCGIKTRLVFTFMLICLFLSVSQYAFAQNHTYSNPHFDKLKARTEAVVNSHIWQRDLRKKSCTVFRNWGGYVWFEMGKLHYNDLYHEIESEEQAADIKSLYDAYYELRVARSQQDFSVLTPKACREAAAQWLAYDNKWYADKRAAEKQRIQEQREEWASQITDTGPGVWDGVMGGIFLHIPREYIWFGSTAKDGVQAQHNLLFHAPDMTAVIDPDFPYPGHDDFHGVLNEAPIIKYLPCQGFKDRTFCRALGGHSLIVSYLGCAKPGAYYDSYKWFRARFRRECKIGDSMILGDSFDEITPVYDEELGAWSLNGEAFYRGSIEFPTYTLICPKFPKGGEVNLTEKEKRYQCKSGIQITDTLYFSYAFPRVNFWKHEEYQEKIRQRLLSFIDESQREQVKEQAYGYLQ